jgi:GAF domain-containing protein
MSGSDERVGGLTPGRAELARQLASVLDDRSALQQLTALAARLLDAPSAHVALISDVQTVVGGVGGSASAVGRDDPADDSLCSLAVQTGDPLVVDDTTVDARTRDLLPVRTGAIGSYLGIPLVVRDRRIGTLCVYDVEPRQWSDEDRDLLQQLAGPAVAELQLAALSADYEDERLVWQLAVDAAGVGAFDWNLQTGDLRWDDRLLELFGVDRQTFGGTIEAFNAAVHPDDVDRVSDALSAAIGACGAYTAEYRVVLPDGVVRWVAARGRAIAGPDGTAVRVLGAAFDTTAVEEGDARVSRVLEAMPTAFFQLDPDWRFTYLNSGAHRLLGAVGTDLIGGVVWDLFPEAVGSDFERHYRGAVETGEQVEFEAYYPPPLDRWYEVRGWPTPDGLSVYFIDITGRRKAEAAVARATERTIRLATVTEVLAENLDIRHAAANLARVVVGPWADWSVVTLVDPSTSGFADHQAEGERGLWRRGLHDVAGWHADPASRELVDRYREVRIASLADDALLAQALREDRPVVIQHEATEAILEMFEPGEARDLCRELAPSSIVGVPLRGRGRIVGLLTVFRGPGSEPFTDDDVADLVDAAGRAGLALDNLRLYAEQRDLAEGLQRSLMTAPPEPDHLHIVVRYEPAAEAAQVGGDWYDAFLQADGATSIVIGDVVGHDTAAAAAMGQVRGLLRGIAVTTGDGPAGVLRRVDEAVQTLQIETTATGIVARFEQTPEEMASGGDTRFRWSNAGHPPPLVAVHPEAPETPETHFGGGLTDPADVSVTELWPEQPELMLGLDPTTDRSESVLTLTRGTTVLLYTDGLVERRGQLLDDGVAKLSAVVAELVARGVSLDTMCDELLRRMLPDRPEDDVALVAVRLHPQDRPRPHEAGPERLPETLHPASGRQA